MSSAGFQRFSQETIRASQEREREVIDADNLTPLQLREIWPDLKRFLSDPCSAILLENIEKRLNDPVSRAETFARKQAARQMRDEIQQMRPR